MHSHIKTYRKFIGVRNLVPCKWGSWVESHCTATCGKSATRTRNRKKLQKASNRKKECKGRQKITVSCNLDECPGKGKLLIENSIE